jgi:hypothetical protein
MSDTPSMVERIARAVDENITSDPLTCEPEMFKDIARAVLKELQTPTPAMVEAGQEAIGLSWPSHAPDENWLVSGWQAMLTRALKE